MTPTGSSVETQPVSPRVMLATLAERVIGEMPGVGLTDGGSTRWQTVGSGRRVAGVTAVVEGGGRYELELRVVVAWPPRPLGELADELRRRIAAAAAEADLDGHLGQVNVTVVGVDGPEDRS